MRPYGGNKMGAIYSWVKNMICCLCMLELLYHIVQNTEYQRYLRFFGGLIFMLLTVGPVLDLFDLQASFDKALQMATIQEEAWNLKEAADSLGELQNRKIEEAYKNELKRQIEAIVKGHDRYPEKTSIQLEENGGVWRILTVKIQLSKDHRGEQEAARREAEEMICAEISTIYGIAKENISITVKG